MIAVTEGDPRSPEGTALLTASHAYLQSLYPPQDNHFLSIDDLCAPHITFLIARDGERDGERDGARGGARALGCAALADFGSYAEVKSMFTDPAARGVGIGAALMSAVEGIARQRGLPLLRLETGDDLYPAHRLYERHGFVRCGPFGDYRDGPHSVFMEKQL